MKIIQKRNLNVFVIVSLFKIIKASEYKTRDNFRHDNVLTQPSISFCNNQCGTCENFNSMYPQKLHQSICNQKYGTNKPQSIANNSIINLTPPDPHDLSIIKQDNCFLHSHQHSFAQDQLNVLGELYGEYNQHSHSVLNQMTSCQLQSNECEQQNNTVKSDLCLKVNSTLESLPVFLEDYVPIVNSDQDSSASPIHYSEEKQQFYMQAKRHKSEGNDVFTVLKELESNSTSTNVQQNQQDYIYETPNILQPTILSDTDMFKPNYEKYFKNIITDYAKFKDLEITKGLFFIKRKLNEIKDTNINDSFINFTLENIKDTEILIEYSDEEKIEIKKVELKLNKIFHDMDSTISYDLSLEHLEKLISESQKYVIIEKELLHNINNDSFFQKYIIHFIDKLMEENKLRLSILFCEISSLNIYTFLNHTLLFFKGNRLRIVYLFKILTIYSSKCELISEYLMTRKEISPHYNIKPIRYVLRRIILEIAYNLYISENHIEIFSVISYLDLIIYKLVENNQKHTFTFKKVILCETIGSVFFTLNSEEIKIIKANFKMKLEMICDKFTFCNLIINLKIKNFMEKTVEDLCEILCFEYLCASKSFLISICNKFILLIKSIQRSRYYRQKISHKKNLERYKKVNQFFENFLLNMKKVVNNELTISVVHIKFIYIIYQYMLFYKLNLVVFGIFPRYISDLNEFSDIIFK